MIAEATALLELDSTNSWTAWLIKLRNPKCNRRHGSFWELTPWSWRISTLIKNAVNDPLVSRALITPQCSNRIASWADVVGRSGMLSYPSTPNSRASTTASVKDREIVVKLDANLRPFSARYHRRTSANE
jgi:hypothetical protein